MPNLPRNHQHNQNHMANIPITFHDSQLQHINIKHMKNVTITQNRTSTQALSIHIDLHTVEEVTLLTSVLATFCCRNDKIKRMALTEVLFNTPPEIMAEVVNEFSSHPENANKPDFFFALSLLVELMAAKNKNDKEFRDANPTVEKPTFNPNLPITPTTPRTNESRN